MLVSDYISIGSLKSLKNSGLFHYLSNKRILPLNDLTKTYFIAETVHKIFKENDKEVPTSIKINGKEINSYLALVLARFLKNPDKTHPELKHNKFLKECIENLPKRYDLELNVVRRIKKYNRIGKYFPLTNIGICLNYSPESVVTLERVIEDIKDINEKT